MDFKTSNKKLCSKNIPYVRTEDSIEGCKKNHAPNFIFQYRIGFFAVLFSTLIVGCFCMIVIYFNMHTDHFSESNGKLPHSASVTLEIDPEARTAVFEMASDDDIILPNMPFFSNEVDAKTRRRRQIRKPKNCKSRKNECRSIMKAVREVTQSMRGQLEELKNKLIGQGILSAKDPQEINYQKIYDCLACGNAIDHKQKNDDEVTTNFDRHSGAYISGVPYFDNRHFDEDDEAGKINNREGAVKNDERVERGLHVTESVTNSSKMGNDGAKITEILHKTTIVEKDEGGVDNNNRGQTFQYLPVNVQNMGTRGGGGESHVTRNMGAVTPTAETTMMYQQQQQNPFGQPGNSGNIPSALHPFIVPTAESTKYSQQIQITPQASSINNSPLIPLCFYNAPPSPSGTPQQQQQQPFFFPPQGMNPSVANQQMKLYPNWPINFQSPLPQQFFQGNPAQGTTPFPHTPFTQTPFPMMNQAPQQNPAYYCTYVPASSIPQQYQAVPQAPMMNGYQYPFLARADSGKPNQKETRINDKPLSSAKSTFDEDDDKYFFDVCNGFTCPLPYRKCIPYHQRCDGRVDCIGAEDEIGCPIQVDNYYSRFMADTQRGGAPRNQQNVLEDMTRTITSYLATTNNPIMETTDGNDVEIETTTFKITLPDIPKHFVCKRIIQTVEQNKRCNGAFDCEDASDEEGCTCKDYLNWQRPFAVCDGHVDCSDGSDEEGCDFCGDNEYHCYRSETCIPKHKMCNKVNDCRFHEDELDCYVLTDGKHVNLDLDKRPHLNLEGVLTNYERGAWRPQCFTSEYRSDAKRVTLAQRVCEYLGFRSMDSINEVIVQKSKLKERSATKDYPIGYEYPPHFTPMLKGDNDTCYGLYIRCKPILDRKVNLHVKVRDNERSYTWPWEGSVFADGKYQCPAVLLENDVLLASSKCAQNINLRHNYTTAVLGVSSPHVPYSGAYQQTSQVVDVRPIKNSDASLFRLRDKVNMTRYVQPIYLEKRIFPASRNDSCVAIGVTDTGRRTMKFLHPVLDCPKCHRCYIDNDDEGCSRRNETVNWSGNIVCLSGNGGWYPTAVFQDMDENCGFTRRQTLNSIDYIHAHLSEAIDERVANVTELDCNGVRCSLGECIPWERVCDGIRDCRDGADENHDTCQQHVKKCEENTAECRCKPSELRCGNGKCVSKEKFCDGRIDCADGSDEPASCTCAEYLKLTRPRLVCDNRRHCLDKTDEDYRYCHCKDNSFKCTKSPLNGTVACVTPDVVCDGHPDCPEGEDESEATCNGIKRGRNDPYGKGEFQRRHYGEWQSACWPEPAKTQAQAQTACKKIGFETGLILDSKPADAIYVPRNDFYMFQPNNHTWLTMREDASFGAWVKPTIPCYKVFVQCF